MAAGHDGDMLNIWTWSLLAGTAGCVVLAWAAARLLGRAPRAVGLGVLLIPVTSLYLWTFGITAWFPTWVFSVHGADVTDNPGRPVFLFGAASHGEAFLLGMFFVAIAAVCTALAPRQSAYAAAVGLVVLGLFQAFLAIANGSTTWGFPYWCRWLVAGAGRALVWGVAFGSLTAGFSLTRRTIVADLKARKTLSARVERLTETRAEAVDAAAAELRRLERDLHDGAQARLVALGISLRTAERMIRTSPDAAETLVAECREASSQALADLRDLVRGIYPPVLADRGLGAFDGILAVNSPVGGPTIVVIDVPCALSWQKISTS